MENKKILVVEDERIIGMEIKNRLESLGYNVVGAVSSGEEAIKKAGETSPDLILMDIVLKGDMDGIEAAKEIYNNFDIPVVYLTAYADEVTFLRAKITGPFGYILKPFRETEFLINIELALYKHNMERKLKDSKIWLAATLNSIGDAVIAADKHGNIKLMNPFAEALTGWKCSDAINKPLKDVFIVLSEKGKEDPMEKVIKEGAFYGLSDNNMLTKKDGSKLPVEIIGSPIIDEKNRMLGVVIVFYDIIERKKIESTIKKNVI